MDTFHLDDDVTTNGGITNPVPSPEQPLVDEGGTVVRSTRKIADKTYVTLVKVFLVLGTIMMALSLFAIPLCWCIPMTVVIMRKLKSNQPIGLGLKIATIFLINPIAGILLVVRPEL